MLNEITEVVTSKQTRNSSRAYKRKYNRRKYIFKSSGFEPCV